MSAPASLPLFVGELQAPIARYGTKIISRAQFLADAMALAERLPDNRHALNLCANRYHFLVAFAAALLSERVSLFPHSGAPRALDDLAKDYAAFRIDDPMVQVVCGGHEQAPERTITLPTIPAEREAAVLFTSGSTGKPAAQTKNWGELVGSSRAAVMRLQLASRHDIVATVPAQHSYGFESSVLYALSGAAVIHDGQPLFPADVHAALASMDAPRILVTTPLHLEACLNAELDWPQLAFCLSATSPLSREVALKAEAIFKAPMREIFGSSETGAIASRRTATESAWTPYEGVQLRSVDSGFQVAAAFFRAPRALSDRFTIEADGRFEWLGRQADQIKIAGKRTTLAELNQCLLAIAGVEDGGFILPETHGKRLAAIVVAPGLATDEIRAQLAASLDAVFLPRPLLKVAALKRTATGKLPRAQLLAQLEARTHSAASS